MQTRGYRLRHALAGKGFSRWRLGLFLVLATALGLPAQTFVGTNAPGAYQDFAISLAPGTTNLAVVVPGSSTTFSHLLLKQGVAQSDTDYDYIALGNGQTNAINLEAPEFVLTNYVLRVRTPATSLTHEFTVTVATNVADVHTAARPATKPLLTQFAGSITSNSWQFFRIDAPTNLPGWRVVLYSTNTAPNPDIYLQTNQLPTGSSWLKRSTNANPDTLFFTNTEARAASYFIGVYLPATTNTTPVHYTLATEFAEITPLTWDLGLTHEGTQVYTNSNLTGGDYYFRIVTQNTAVGAWRHALNVLTGEAGIYLSRGSLPTAVTNLYKSERAGADGFVVPATAFNAGEEWFLMVRANPGSRWSLVTGEPFVTDLGTVAADESSGSGPLPMGAEGMRFFQTTLPVNSAAWRLWLHGLTNSILVKKAAVPVPSNADLSQSGQMLVVPGYLIGGQLYLVGVSGAPGTTINLDSRQQAIIDLPFESSTNLVMNGYGYATFRVQVPYQQLAWQAGVRVSEGNPNIAVRRNCVPNEFNNDAYSEAPGSVSDSITLVPPTLSDGTFFITVYSASNYSCTLQSGTPEVTEIDFSSATLNLDTNRVGWRLFKVSDVNSQVGALGWDLFVTNCTPGTKIAVRYNGAPGLWNYRMPPPALSGALGTYDAVSTADFLQRPRQQAQVWYVGVFNTNAALGNFTLVTRPLTAELTGFDGGTTTRTNVPAAKWQYFRVDVPAGCVGWDVRLTEVIEGRPQLVVAREVLPIPNGPQVAPTIQNWPNGQQWVADADWTARPMSPDGGLNESGRILTFGLNRPMEPGTYYVGVLSTNVASYSLLSRGIGTNNAIAVQDVAYAGGSVTNSFLAPRDIAVYRVALATNVASWKVKLTATSGDVLLAVGKDRMPNIAALVGSSVTNTSSAGKKMNRKGSEHYVQLPLAWQAYPLFEPAPGQNTLAPGNYYFVVASEGLTSPGASTCIGSGSASYVFTSLGRLPETNLGLLENDDLAYDGQLEGGEAAAFHFENLTNTLGFEVSLTNCVGNPVLVVHHGATLTDPGIASPSSPGVVPADPYGNEGGENDWLECSPSIVTSSGCFTNETVMVKARKKGSDWPDASYQLRVRKLTAEPLAFDGGTATVADQTTIYQFFRVEVPTNALGWDMRIVNVTAGSPKLLISRDYLPLFLPTIFPGTSRAWPAGEIWIAGQDWTQRAYSADGKTNEDGRIIVAGMGRPLEPGTYYVGIYNAGASASMSYSVLSRGIGDDLTIPVVELPFTGGNASHAGLAPREAAYYRVIVPPGASSWQAKVTAITGDVALLTLTNALPGIHVGRSAAYPGKLMLKPGNEHFVQLPVANQTSLRPGINFLAVASMGVLETNSTTRIGSGTSSFQVESRGELQVVDLGAVGGADLVHSGTLEGGEVRAYQFAVPPGLSGLEAQLSTQAGYPAMVLRAGPVFPDPGSPSNLGGAGTVLQDYYGNEGGYAILSGLANTNLISLSSPTNGLYTLMVKARAGALAGSYSNAAYTLTVRAVGYTTVDFDGGSFGVTNQTGNTWKFFRIDVPTNALGWDLRLVGVTAGAPKLVVRRDMFPESLLTMPWSQPGTVTNWPSTNQWAVGSDWTRRTTSANNLTNEDGRIFAAGMGAPLAPGTYYAGVMNGAGTNAMTYTLLSRGIGEGFVLPVTDLPFNGGCITNLALAPREAAYYRVVVPPEAGGCKLRLGATEGEVMLLALKNAVPNIDTARSTSYPKGKYMQKAGNEHFVELPTNSASMGGTYYLAVVGEGVNPASALRIGTGNSSYVLSCAGNPTVTNLGTLGPVDLVSDDSLEGGESRFYQFTVPAAAGALEVRLENRVGNPVMVLLTNAALPNPGAVMTGANDVYGNEGGYDAVDVNTNILTVPNPLAGRFTVAVKARFTATGVYPDAHYTLRVRQIPVPELNFTAEFNTNGLRNVASGFLLDNQRAYYRVVVPADVQGAPVLGWQLDVSQLSGLAYVRARKDFLPFDAANPLLYMPFTPNAAVVAPPFLTPGTWYVEVKGSNSTAFTLTSSALGLQRPPWQMPGLGEAVTTPGLSAPEFADSGLDTTGAALPADQGIDLPQGRYHYYAVAVPTNNGALLRAQLDVISGNSDLYLRVGSAPTCSHTTNGTAGTSFDRAVTGSATEYANWVPVSGLTQTNLTPGTWYLAVRASASANSRYRLRLSTGYIQDLDFSAGSALNQTVAGGDWRYYRVQVPPQLPANWQLTFSQQAGNVVMHLRDTVPPGNTASVGDPDIRDWATDKKNSGSYGSYDAPATYSFSTPMVRLGSIYYIGFRGKSDSTFSISSSCSGDPLPVLPVINFYGGYATNFLPAYSQVLYQIPTPADALRWRHSALHSAQVQLFIENGSIPSKSISYDDWYSSAANSSCDKLLTAYAWLPNQTYFLLVTNTSSSAQPFSFTMNGSSMTADSDGDGLADGWEVRYLLNLGSGPTGDYDTDGVSNWDEYVEGTNPNDRGSLRPRLYVPCTNGTVTLSPSQTNYDYGSTVTLDATPAPGFLFTRWTTNAPGYSATDNPLTLTLTNCRAVSPVFRIPGDDFAQRLALNGWSNSVTCFNTNATRETGEPSHAGNFGGRSLWWSWTAQNSCEVTVTTAGSSFNTLLAVYTGASLTNLTLVAGNDNDGAVTTSRLTFAATAGVTYAIAVDGYGGASGTIRLQVKQSVPPFLLDSQVRLPDGRFQFNLTAEPGYYYDIQASSDLIHWQTIATVPNSTGTMTFTDPEAPLYPRRFYRALRSASSEAPLLLNPSLRSTSPPSDAGQFSFTILSPPGQRVRVLTSSNLLNWVAFATLTNATGTVAFTDPQATGSVPRFYRVVAP